MGWPGRYVQALSRATEVINFYSTGDEVFNELANPPWLLAGMSESTANYCWQKQETKKGSGSLAGTAYAGWCFHEWREIDSSRPTNGMSPFPPEVTKRYSVEDALTMVDNGSITNTPVFNRDYSPMFEHDAPTNDVSLALAKYVPAISSPMGGVPVFADPCRRYDLNSDKYRVGWGRVAVNDATPWKHSDMKDMAYFYVWPLYDELVCEKGSLK